MTNKSDMKLVLIFDTETTGLIPKNANSYEFCPYILQLSYVLYNLETCTIDEIFNEFIKIPSTVKYDEKKIEDINGITRELCNTKGKPLVYVLNQFYMAYLRADCIVAHNIEFDRKMIQIELLRNNLMNRIPMFHPDNVKKEECTMVMSLKLCNIIRKNRWGEPYIKNPKLSETYHKLFDIEPEPDTLHNAIMDTIYCLRCYLKMQHGIEIPEALFATWGYE